MNLKNKPLLSLYILQPIVKGFSVFYFVLLTIFYAEKLISAAELGYIGGLFIILLIFGAVIVSRFLHTMETKKLLQLSSLVSLLASCLLLLGAIEKNVLFLIISYCFMGLSCGTATSGVNALAAAVTLRGDRYKSLANLGMLTDIVRIVFPLLVSGSLVLGSSRFAIMLIILAAGIFFIFSFMLSHLEPPQERISIDVGEGVRKNRNFLYVLSLEFLDSFASSQLFVFLPLIFLAKGYSLESSLVLQSLVFLGYLCGRWFIVILVKKYSGTKAVSYAEFGMVISIIFLLFAKDLVLLYTLCFILGIFTRGTSPAIKALAFDSLTQHQMKKGSALHVVAGDSGSALGQLLFGFFIAWYGVNSPFIASAVVALFVGIISFMKPVQLNKMEI
ncbi:MAG TPA: MFS transporter [Candidatus Saccharimonadales bacterium]|nr:MFS transporter [Candidatus Saccharimonadales bacterium]